MPALYVLNRRWRIATDVVPVPTLFGGLFNAALLAACAANWAAWRCTQDVALYTALLGAFTALYAYGVLLDTAICIAGCRGTPLEETPRRAVPFLVTLSVVTFWPLHLLTTIFGTVVVHLKRDCTPRSPIIAIVYASWASWLFTWCAIIHLHCYCVQPRAVTLRTTVCCCRWCTTPTKCATALRPGWGAGTCSAAWQGPTRSSPAACKDGTLHVVLGLF